MANKDDAVQRSLGHIEGTLDQLLNEFKNMRGELVAHTAEDRANFSAVDVHFEEATRARNQHLNEQDAKLDKLKQDADRAKGAGYIILALLSALATFMGGALLSIWTGWIRLHT